MSLIPGIPITGSPEAGRERRLCLAPAWGDLDLPDGGAGRAAKTRVRGSGRRAFTPGLIVPT